MQRSNLHISAAAMLVLLAVAGCGKEEAPPPPPSPTPAASTVEEQVVKIGHAGPLTGQIAHLGKDNENGVAMAIADANAAGIMVGGKKLKFEIISEDDSADPKNGQLVAQKLVDAKVVGVVGHLNSGTSIPASKVYSDAGIAQISPSATAVDYTNQGFKTTFRVIANDAQQGRVLAEFATQKLSAKKIAIIDDRSAYGKGLADVFEKVAKGSGAKVLAREFTQTDATDFKAILTKIKGKKPELVFFGGMDAQGGPMAKQLKQLGVSAKFMMGDGGQSPKFIELAGDAAADVYASTPGVPRDKMPRGIEFNDKYKAKYNQDIQIYAPYAYDATMALIDAIKKADSVDAAKVAAELAKVEHDGVTGKFAFDEKGDIKGGEVTVYQVQNGAWVALETMGGAAAAAAAPADAAAPAGAAPAAAPAAEAKKDEKKP